MIDVTPTQRRLTTIVRPPVLSRLLLFWSLLLLVAATALLWEPRLGRSLLWGVAISALPGFCFAWYGLRDLGGARQSRLALQGLYRAETIRFLCTAALFAAVFMRVEGLHPIALMVAFVGTHLGASLVTARTLARWARRFKQRDELDGSGRVQSHNH